MHYPGIYIFFFLIPFFAFSQEKEKKKPVKTLYFNREMRKLNPDSSRLVDTSLFLFHQYNPVYTNDGYYENIGNAGNPAFSLILDAFEEPGFNLGLDPFFLSRRTPEKMKYFDSYTPFTHLFYVQGPKELQQLYGVHSRNITPGWNASVQFKRFPSTGFYDHQRSNNTYIGLNTWFNTKNERYKAYTSVIWNKFRQQENGGITNDTLFRLNNGSPSLTQTNLDDPWQTWRSRDLSFSQYYFPGKTSTDTLIHSKDTAVIKEVKGKYYFSHNVRYSQLKYAFKDPKPNISYYPAIFIDSTFTRDTLFSGELFNKLTFGTRHPISKGPVKISYSAGLQNQYVSLTQINKDSTINNYSATGNLKLTLSDFTLKSRLHSVFAGSNSGDLDLNTALHYRLGRRSGIKLEYHRQSRQPSFRQTSMISNHINWQNSFSSVRTENVKLEFKPGFMNTRISFFYTRMNNWIYYSTGIAPGQESNPVGYWGADLQTTLNWNHFYWDNHARFQRIDGKKIIHLPEWVYRSTLYYQNNLFKDALFAQFGINFRYNSPYLANAYFPSYGIFYLQNQSVTGGYPYFDLFISGRVKRFRGFIKLEHINQGLSGFDYFLLPGYPYHPRTLRFGVSWMFFD